MSPSSTLSVPPAHTRRRVWDMVKTPLTLLFLLAILFGAAKWSWRAINTPIPGPAPIPCVATNVPALTSEMVTVSVLNGSTERGRASGVAANLKVAGFTVAQTGNSEERITQTIIRGAKADNPEVLLVAGFFVEPRIEADGRTTGTVDVLIGPRPVGTEADPWAAMKQDAPRQVPVASGTACVPAKPTPTTTPA